MLLENLLWSLLLGTGVFLTVLLGYTDLAVIHEVLARRDRSVPVRWTGGECKGYRATLGLSFAAVLGWLTLPMTAGVFLFLLLFFLLGIFGFLAYVTGNIEYRLPPRDGVERSAFLDRSLFG
jgi:hypothetical protein